MKEQTKVAPADAPLTLADIAEPVPSGGTTGFRIRRACRKVYHLLLPKSMSRVVTRGGIRYSGRYSDFAMPDILKNGYFEREQIIFFFNEARRRGARVFLDVGAYVGYYSLLAARLGIFDEIHAFEPHPETYKRLLWHIKANNFEGVIIPHNVAASDEAGDFRISRMIVHKDSAPADSAAIKAAPLDSLFDFRGKTLAMKIDTEGHEMPALDGAKNLLTNNDTFMQIEILPDQTQNIIEMLSRGYSLIHRYSNDFYFAGESGGVNAASKNPSGY